MIETTKRIPIIGGIIRPGERLVLPDRPAGDVLAERIARERLASLLDVVEMGGRTWTYVLDTLALIVWTPEFQELAPTTLDWLRTKRPFEPEGQAWIEGRLTGLIEGEE